MSLKCLTSPPSVFYNGQTGHSSPTYYGVFVMFTEDEGNIICDFSALSDSIYNAKVMVNQLLNQFKKICSVHEQINQETNFTYIGNRKDLKLVSNRHYGSCNGFIIEELEFNQLCPAY